MADDYIKDFVRKHNKFVNRDKKQAESKHELKQGDRALLEKKAEELWGEIRTSVKSKVDAINKESGSDILEWVSPASDKIDISRKVDRWRVWATYVAAKHTIEITSSLRPRAHETLVAFRENDKVSFANLGNNSLPVDDISKLILDKFWES